MQGRIDLLGCVLFAMLFLQFGIRDYQPAALLIPPYIVRYTPSICLSFPKTCYQQRNL